MRVLVVYFSYSGRTLQVAAEIARGCGADLEEILEARPHAGAWTALKATWESLIGATPPIEPPTNDPSNYDLVILGTPVWAGRMASPVRSYITLNAKHFKRVAFFCAEGAGGDKRVFAELGGLCGKVPTATCCVAGALWPEPAHPEPLQNFMAHLAAA